jgi:hypothetical protein
MEWSPSRPGHFTPRGKRPWYPLNRVCLSPRVGLDAVEKRKSFDSDGNQIPAVQPIARRYTVWAVPGPATITYTVFIPNILTLSANTRLN